MKHGFFSCENPTVYCTECFRYYKYDFINCNSIHNKKIKIVIKYYSEYFMYCKRLHPDFIIKKGLYE
jgi:hypothetical protein